MTELVVLPGLDGTATLHDEFVSAVAPHFKSVRVIAYPFDAPLGYSELERLVRSQLPEASPFVLLGESFSGPLAITIASSPPPNLVGLVLSTTFAKSPVPFSRAISALAHVGPVRALPMPFLSWLLLGSWSTPTLRDRLRAALRRVSPSALRARAVATLRVDATALLPLVRVPVLCLYATSDRLLRAGAVSQLQSRLPRATTVQLPGPHLLLQAAPERAARAVGEFLVSSRAGC